MDENGFNGEMTWWRDRPGFEDFRFSPSGRRGLSVRIAWEDVPDDDSYPHIQLHILDLLTNDVSEYTLTSEVRTSVTMHYLNYYWLNETTVGTIESGEKDFYQRILELDHEESTATSIETRIYPHTGDRTQDSSRSWPIVFEKEVYLVYIAYPFPYLPVMYLVPWSPFTNAVFRMFRTTPDSASYVFGDPIVYGSKIFFRVCSWENGYFEISADSIRSIDLNKKKRLEIEDFETVILDKEEYLGCHRIHQYQCGPNGRYLVLYAFDEPWNIHKNIFIIDLKLLTARKMVISVPSNEVNNSFTLINNRLIRFYLNLQNLRHTFMGVYRRIAPGVPDLTELCINWIMLTDNRIEIPKHIARIIFPH